MKQAMLHENDVPAGRKYLMIQLFIKCGEIFFKEIDLGILKFQFNRLKRMIFNVVKS